MLGLEPTMLVAACTVLGLLIGSFLNVVIHRLPIMMERDWQRQCAEASGKPQPSFEPLSLISPRSRCPHCGHAIGALENIPIISYLFLRGRCKGCGKPISVRYPLIEALTAVLFGYAAWRFGSTPALAGALLFIAALISLSFIDADTQLLPDDITLPLIWVGLLFNLNGTFTTLQNAVIGAVAGYVSLWLVYWAFKLTTGKEGMGYGDFKLLAAIGAWFGWQMLPLVILLSSLVGALVGIALIVLARHDRNVPIPFGPYLAAAGVIALLWGKELTQAWLGLIY
ncbi:prepilin peptidase [Sulfuricystis multivorans]|uniref:prepilin peptidase n=1 Tax=Sulfuricystis multivorans TaxID=2211108 RepID=UPI000F82B542|nr:A24 family peptidase [Sulfuricystis multivorans]